MSNLPSRLTGASLGVVGAAGNTRAVARANRQAAQQIASLQAEEAVARAVAQARVRLIESTTRSAMQSSGVIFQEAVLLARLSPAATGAIETLAQASTAGLARVVIDAGGD